MVASKEVEFGLVSETPLLVKPSRETPSEVLYLSNLDDQLFLRFTIKYIFAFRRKDGVGDDAVDLLRRSLSDVLVHYYPLAGRLREVIPSEKKLQVVCNGEGAVFVEAFADISVEELLRYNKPCQSWKKLLRKFDSESFVGVPPLVIQVTRMRCGGCVVCVGFSHCLCDGIGTSQFITAWTEIARGETSPRLTPSWERHLLMPRNPPRTEYSHPEFTPVEDISHIRESLRPEAVVRSSVIFRSENLLELKAAAVGLSTCTSFEALAAHVWRSWVRAMEMPNEQKIKLLFSVNVRHRFEPPLPCGFYGNGFVLACAESTVAKLTKRPLAYAVRLVQRAKAKLTDGYLRSVIDTLELQPCLRPDLAATLVISQWSRLGLTRVDFGWGRPAHAGPLASDIYCLFLQSDDDLDESAVKVLLSVPRRIRETYESLMLNPRPNPPLSCECHHLALGRCSSLVLT